MCGEFLGHTNGDNSSVRGRLLGDLLHEASFTSLYELLSNGSRAVVGGFDNGPGENISDEAVKEAGTDQEEGVCEDFRDPRVHHGRQAWTDDTHHEGECTAANDDAADFLLGVEAEGATGGNGGSEHWKESPLEEF